MGLSIFEAWNKAIISFVECFFSTLDEDFYY